MPPVPTRNAVLLCRLRLRARSSRLRWWRPSSCRPPLASIPPPITRVAAPRDPDAPPSARRGQRTRRPRLRLKSTDRVHRAWRSRTWRGWRSALHIVKPETVVGWHRRGFRLFWTWKSRRRTGRPGVRADVRALIRELSTANPLWVAPRIHGELQKSAIVVSQSTVAKYMGRHPRPSSQTWQTFLTNRCRSSHRSQDRTPTRPLT